MTAAEEATLEGALDVLAPYVRPGFEDRWIELASVVGYRRLAQAVVHITPTALESSVTVVSERAQRVARKTSGARPDCRFAYKVTGGRRPRLVANRRHVCRPACGWTVAEELAWLDATPYPSPNPERTAPPVRRGITFCLCKLPMNGQHYESVADDAGHLQGLREIRCPFVDVAPLVPNL